MQARTVVASLVPHGPGALFVDEILSTGEHEIRCRVVPGRHDAPLVVDGRVPSFVAIEYMAQTVGVYVGLHTKNPSWRRLPGHIIGLREFTVQVDAFEVGAPLVVHARWDWGEDEVGRFATTLEDVHGTLLASAGLTVYRRKPEPGA